MEYEGKYLKKYLNTLQEYLNITVLNTTLQELLNITVSSVNDKNKV